MNREIKFRAWDGSGMHNGTCIDWFLEMDMILLQFTGLKDKNKKDIYEGDIIRCVTPEEGTHIGQVFYWERSFYCCRETDFLQSTFEAFAYQTKCLEVIGNIYQNPELIK